MEQRRGVVPPGIEIPGIPTRKLVKGERRMLRKHGSIAILHDLGFVLIHDDLDHTPEAFPDRAAKAWIRHVDGPYPMQDVLPPGCGLAGFGRAHRVRERARLHPSLDATAAVRTPG